jgi:hypothetical protein
MELSLRPGITVVAVATASVIAVASVTLSPVCDVRVPALELSAAVTPVGAGPGELPNPLSAVIGTVSADPGSDAGVGSIADSGALFSGTPALDVLPDLGISLSSLDDTLASVITTLATIAIAAGVGVAGLYAAPFSLVGGAVTSLGAAIAGLGGVFTPIGTAVGGFAEVPAGIAELIEANGAVITQGIVTPIYDFLINLVSPDSDPTIPPSDLAQALDPGAVLDFGRLLPDLLTVF